MLHLDEANARALAAALERHVVRRPLRRVQAVPPLAVRPVPYDDAAAGGQRASSASARRRPCRSRRSCTRTASSPICVRTPRRCPTPRSTAARAQVTQLYGADYLPDKPRTYAGKVKNAQEAHEAIRPSGDRFRTPGRDRPDRRPVPALRADLEAHRRLPDEGRGRQLRHRQDRRHRRRRPGRRVLRLRQDHHLPRLPEGLRRGRRRPERRAGRPRAPAAAGRRGRRR